MEMLMLPPGEGESVVIAGLGKLEFKVHAEQTGGTFAAVEHPIEPGRLVPPHLHIYADEVTYVLAGELGVRIGDEIVTATAGSYIFKPRGIPHTFWNTGTETGRIIEMIFPAGFEQFFPVLAKLLDAGADTDQLTEAYAQYHTIPHLEWVPELTAKYGVKLLGQ